MVPLVVFIVFAGVYKLFELFVRRKERMMWVDKLGDRMASGEAELKADFSIREYRDNSFVGLKIACLLLGIGAGMLAGFLIIHYCRATIDTYSNVAGMVYESNVAGMVYGACMFIFGGLGLLIAFFQEMKYRKKKNE